MIKFIAILTGCSLALAASVQAEQENPEKKPEKKSKPVQKQQFTPKQYTAPKSHVQTMPTQHNNIPSHNNVNGNVPKKQFHTLPAVQSNKVPAVQTYKVPPAQTYKVPAARTYKGPPIQTNKLPAVQTNKLPAVQSNKVPAIQTNKLPAVQPNKFPANNQTVKTFHPQHVNFHATPNTAIASVRFNQHYRIHGSENWSGTHYNAFRLYRPSWHDRGWWHSHHNHIILIGGGWYFWNAGYWYPAWGYDTSAAYYPYDGPIYVGNNPTPFDQIVADVQTTLQEQGYYNGEVDGLVGPLTQEALAAYQSAQGLEPTASIDEPTLASLGLG